MIAKFRTPIKASILSISAWVTRYKPGSYAVGRLDDVIRRDGLVSFYHGEGHRGDGEIADFPGQSREEI